MSNIGRVDQAVMQLRAQLRSLARDRAKGAASIARVEPRALERLRQTGPNAGLGEKEFRQKFVRALLTEELGEALGNQPEFERISIEVWTLLDEDPEMSTLMDAAIQRLRMSAP